MYIHLEHMLRLPFWNIPIDIYLYWEQWWWLMTDVHQNWTFCLGSLLWRSRGEVIDNSGKQLWYLNIINDITVN